MFSPFLCKPLKGQTRVGSKICGSNIFCEIRTHEREGMSCYYCKKNVAT